MIMMRTPYPRLSGDYGNAIISQGTSRTCDLLKAFAEALLEVQPKDNDAKYAMSLLGQWGDFGYNTELYITLRSQDVPAKDAYEVIWDIHRLTYQILPDRLSEMAPKGYAFGLNPDVPQLLGYWPTEITK